MQPSSLAVKMDINTPPGSFMASMGNKEKTDGSWECSRTNDTGWEQPDFKERKWSAAVTIQRNDVEVPNNKWVYVTNIARLAYWISDSPSMSQIPGTVYCRKQFNFGTLLYMYNHTRTSIIQLHIRMSTHLNFRPICN